MSEPEDDTTGADPPDRDSAEPPQSDVEHSPESAPPTEAASASVAAQAGIDEEALDVSRELDATVRFLWVIGSLVGAVVLAVIAAVVTFVVGMQTTAVPETFAAARTVGGAVFGFMILLSILRAVLRYRSWSYVIRADSLFLSRGVLTRVRTVVPYVRVQHIDTTRGPLERLLGLSTLVVYTAGSRGADVTIPGLTPERASTLQERLERLAIESEEADAV